jgi:hypothetical protein
MSVQGLPLAATVLLTLPMVYFLIASLTFFLRGFDDPVVGWMLRGLLSFYFVAVTIGCALGAAAFAVAGRPVVAAGLAGLVLADLAARRWFLRRLDRAIAARDGGEAGAIGGLRRVHLGGIAWNGAQLAAVLACIPRVFPGV